MIETIEWSEFLKLLNNSEKAINYIPNVNNSQDITRLAVSLANQNGGLIVIGFDKHNIQLRGVDFDAKWLNAILYNECKPTIMFALKDTIKNKKRIFVVEVKEGQEKPYTTYGVSYIKHDNRIQEVLPEQIQTEVPAPVSDIEPGKMEKRPIGSNISTREQKCLEYLKQYHIITNSKYREINYVSHKTAHNELSDLVDKNLIRQVGQGRSTSYVLIDSEIKDDDSSGKEGMKSNDYKEEPDILTGADKYSSTTPSDVEQNDLFGSTIDSIFSNSALSKTEIRKSSETDLMNAHHIVNSADNSVHTNSNEAQYVFNDEIIE